MRLGGLSPRARGNRLRRAVSSNPYGSIPACTGEPPLRAHSLCRRRVYPRVHGGTTAASLFRMPRGGLSPRARGNHAQHLLERVDHRSIPACTGEPSASPSMYCLYSVYPRVHGGTELLAPCVRNGKGLSPRARGNRDVLKLRVWRVGSIPACTGEPRTRLRLGSRCRVYPRVHGGTGDPARSLCR